MIVGVAGRNRMVTVLMGCIAGLAVVMLACAVPARAAYPGTNGLIVFEKYDTGGVLQVWSAHSDGTNPRQLTHDPGAVADPVVSPDGQKIAFINSAAQLTVMDIGGTNPKSITAQNANIENSYPTWSPDGTKIAYSSINFEPPSGSPENDIWVINSDGTGTATDLTPSTGLGSLEPAWSPDGTTIAFVRAQSSDISTNQIWEIPSQGGTATRVTSTMDDSDEPAWSPDGSKIVFSNSDASGFPQLATMDKNGSNETTLTTTALNMTNPDYSPDGTKIIAAGLDPNSTATTGLYTVNPSTGAETQLPSATFGGNSADQPSWQPIVQRALTVAENGTGSGTVTSTPSAISCPGTCTENVVIGSQVTLHAAAAATGSYFAGWSGGGCSGTQDCTVTVSAATTVTATFDRGATLTVSRSGNPANNLSDAVVSTPSGISCGNGGSCSATFAPGTAVTLTAYDNPPAGFVFTGWVGAGCAGIQTCSFTINADTSVTAEFGNLPPKLQSTTVIAPLFWTGSNEIGDLFPDTISCPSVSLCLAGGQDFYEGFGNNKAAIAVANGSSEFGAIRPWQASEPDGNNQIDAISCPTTTFCAAGDDAGNILTTTDPFQGATASDWMITHVDGNQPINGISCATASNCAAVDGFGRVISSTNPTGGSSAWTAKQITGGAGLNDVSCPGPGLCVAIDGSGSVWTAIGSSAQNQPAIAANWTQTVVNAGHSLAHISCVGSICVVTDDAGDVITTRDPGTNLWTVTNLGGQHMQGVSCSTADVCATSDWHGSAWVTTNPTGGGSAWKSGSVEMRNVSCVTAPLSGLGGDTYCVGTERGEGSYTVGTLPVLSINRLGTGSGTVGISSPTGTSCPNTCNKIYTVGTSLTLTASPSSGDALAGWEGGCNPSGLTCTLTLNQTYTIGAFFSAAPVGSGGTLTLSGSTISGTLTCKTKTACSGAVTFIALGGHLATDASAKSGTAKPQIVAKGSFRIGAHRHGTFRARLTAAGKRLAAKHKLSRLTETIATKAPHHKTLISIAHVRVRQRKAHR